jgi:ribosomal protein L11 methyltransferase
MNHIQITIPAATEALQDLLIAQLAAIGFDGFEQNDTEVKAYIAEEAYDEAALQEILLQENGTFTRELITRQNWNALWESNFQPVSIPGFVHVRAGFHEPEPGFAHEIIITPKMSFGTGHHATTYLMMQEMQSIDFTGKTVFDFGTGTGILAILAEKLGAAYVMGVDNDEWSIENATENAANNQCENISLYLAGNADAQDVFNVILANINKNVILENMYHLQQSLQQGGVLLLSGLLAEDEVDIVNSARAAQLKFIHTVQKDKWICIKLQQQ